MKNKVINLHHHSHYSVLDGMGTPEQIVKKTVELGLPGAAITDHGNMNSYAYLYQYAKKHNIKPMLGCEFYHIKDLGKWKSFYDKVKEAKLKRKDAKEKYDRLRRRNHLILLVKNEQGFENINELVYHAYKNSYYRPRVDHKLIKKYSEGLICSSACLGGELSQMLLKGENEKAQETVDFFKGIFGDDYYIEIQFNELKEQNEVNLKLIEIANKNNIKVIITQDSHYLEYEHFKTHQSLLLLQTKNTYRDIEEGKDVWQFETKELYYKNYKQLKDSKERFNPEVTDKQFKEYCENTFEVFEKIENLELDTSIKMKDINPEIKEKEKHLYNICFKELKNRDLNKKEYVDRLKFEIDVITKKKYTNYFMVISKIVNDAKKKMLVGCGRGSGPGSLVNFLLGITNIDPIIHKLYFERFLAIDRKDYPDIDIDFENNDKIKTELMDKYPGEAACTTSYMTFQLFGLLKDLGRIYNIENASFFDKLNKRVRHELKENYEESDEDVEGKDRYAGITYDESIKFSSTLKNFVKKYPDLDRDMRVLLNQIRHIGRHAAGVVISDKLTRKQPTMIIKNILQTSLSEGTRDKSLTDFGFIKIDVLGLKTLRVMHDTMKYVCKDKGISHEKIWNKVRADRIDLEDEKIFKKIFLDLNLIGIFQFETDNILKMVKVTKPTCFEDLCAMNGLFRPGPLQGGYAFQYGERKKDPESVKYDHPILKKILGYTYGIIIYQEQIMEIGHYLGKMSLAETNVMRKVIVKSNKVEGKIGKQIKELKDKFVKGAMENKVSQEKAEEIWGLMEKFSGYGFNKAHALSYAMIAYQTAWLKTYYPLQFYTALLNSEDEKNYMRIINEIRRNDIEVIAIDLNNSKNQFSYNDGKIYWGFSKIMGIGEKASFELIEARKRKAFRGFREYIVRDDIDWRRCNKRVTETLIKIGAFSTTRNNRKLLLEVFTRYNEYKNHLPKKQELMSEAQKLKALKRIKKKVDEEFKENKKSLDFSEIEKFAIELEFYRLNINNSPFDFNTRRDKISYLVRNGKAGSFESECEYAIVIFTDIKRFNDKRGREMAFINLVDYTGLGMRGIIFSSNYEKDRIKSNKIYLVSGSKDDSFIIDKFLNLDTVLNERAESGRL